jgi:transposase
MVKLLVYGYANGVCSSRKLERATHRDVAIRMLCAGQHPDYRSIARFRARHLDALSELFAGAAAVLEGRTGQARVAGVGRHEAAGERVAAQGDVL